MVLTTTTLTAALSADNSSLKVASATGFAAKSLILIDREFLRVGDTYTSGTLIPLSGRGLNGSLSVAHPSGANVTVGLGHEFAAPAPTVATSLPGQVAREVVSVSAGGALEHPSAGRDRLVILNGTSVLALTLAAPSKEIDGSLLIVVANGLAAHTLTVTGGLGGGGAALDVGTFPTGNKAAVLLVASNGHWCYVGIPSATAAANGVLWA